MSDDFTDRADEPVDPQLHTVPPNRQSMEEQPRWRRDFPIDTPQDNYQARRDFTRFMVLTSGAFVAGQFWIAVRNLWRRPMAELPDHRIAPLAEVPVGGAITFRYPTENDPCLLIRPEREKLLAWSSVCTHLMCPVIPEVSEGLLHCPCHSGYFDLESGEVLAGPPRRNLPRILLEIRDDIVYAVGMEDNRR